MPQSVKRVYVALTQVPPLVGLLFKWSWVAERPLFAALLGLFYEFVWIAGTFGRRVWEELEREAIGATADWLRAATRNFRPGFRRRYNKFIVQEHSVFNVRGLGLINTFTLKLDQVFVNLKIAPSMNPLRANSDPIAPPRERVTRDKSSKQPIWEYLKVLCNAPDLAALAVIGPPGCGKTTLLQHTALTLAMNRQRKHHIPAYIPLLLFLRDHTAVIVNNPSITLGGLAERHFGSQSKTLKPPPGYFERQLLKGKCLVMLDGLDEVAELEKREVISQWVDQQIVNYPDCGFVITSRPQGYRDAPIHRAHVVEVQPFNSSQVRYFVKNWYLANEIKASGNIDNDEVRFRAKRDAEDLLRRLACNRSLDALTVNPLLLTMIAMVHRYHGALPGSRVELYKEICEVLLGRWRQAKGVRDDLTAAQKLVVLQPLASTLMSHKVREVHASEAMSIISPLLKVVGIDDLAARNALHDFQSASGLLLEREAGQWSFAHLTFQEYLTAAHWMEEKHTPANWKSIVGDSWWHETLRLYAAQGDATEIVAACLEVDTLPALTLAAECLDEARKLDPYVRRDMTAKVIEGVESDDPRMRRLAAEVKLSRRLKSLMKINDFIEIDVEYISAAEYQLFLDDVRGGGEYRQPDHWMQFSFPSGAGRNPITGIGFDDAEAFCHWLTQREGGNALFRLPTMREADKWASNRGGLATWCSSEISIGAFDLIGLTLMEENVIERKLNLFSELPPPGSLVLLSMRTRGIEDALIRTLKIKLKLERNTYVRELARDMDVYSALDLACARNFDLDIDFNQAITGNPELNLRLSHDRNRVALRDCDSGYSKTRESSRDRVIATDLARARSLALARAKARRLIDTQSPQELLDLLVNIVKADSVISMRRAQRNYAIKLLEYAYEGYEMISEDARPWYRKKIDYANEKKIVLDTYWRLIITGARESGDIDSWEGIRIVRERIPS